MPSTSWSLNGQTKRRSGNTTILDTGTTLLLVSDEVVDELYGAIEGAQYDDQQGGYKFPSNATLPDVSFAVGDKLYKVRALCAFASLYTSIDDVVQVSGKDLAFADAGDGYVFGGVQSRGNMDFDIFGDIFLKNVYVVCKYS